MAKKSSKAKPPEEDKTFELIKKIVIILAFVIGFGGMIYLYMTG